MNEITQCKKLIDLTETWKYSDEIVEINIEFQYENNIVLED